MKCFFFLEIVVIFSKGKKYLVGCWQLAKSLMTHVNTTNNRIRVRYKACFSNSDLDLAKAIFVALLDTNVQY